MSKKELSEKKKERIFRKTTGIQYKNAARASANRDVLEEMERIINSKTKLYVNIIIALSGILALEISIAYLLFLAGAI